MGESTTVCGVVASAEYEANETNQPTLLDLGKAHPNAIFTAVIYGENRAKFGTPETILRGKRIPIPAVRSRRFLTVDECQVPPRGVRMPRAQ